MNWSTMTGPANKRSRWSFKGKAVYQLAPTASCHFAFSHAEWPGIPEVDRQHVERQRRRLVDQLQAGGVKVTIEEVAEAA